MPENINRCPYCGETNETGEILCKRCHNHLPEFKLQRRDEMKAKPDIYSPLPQPYEEVKVRPLDYISIKYGILSGSTWQQGVLALLAIVIIFAFIYLILSIPW